MHCPCPTIPYDFVPPEGSTNPEVYIVGEAPGMEEAQHKRPFLDKAGVVLRSALQDAKIDMSKVRIGYVVCCRPTDINGYKRTPEPAEIANCALIVQSEIHKMKPKYIACLGGTALSAFIPDYKSGVGQAMQEDFKWQGIPLRVFYNPSYLERKGGISCQEYGMMQRFFKGLFPGSSIIIPDTKIIETSEECAELLSTLKKEKEVGFDIETNGFPIVSDQFQMFGVGFATRDQCYYHTVKDDLLDYRTAWVEYLRDVQNLVYNMGFEGIALSNLFNISIHDMNFVDVRQFAVVKQELRGLKSLARMRLGFPNWSKEVESMVDPVRGQFAALIKLLKPTNRYPRKEFAEIEEKGAEAYLARLIERKQDTQDPAKKAMNKILQLSSREEQLMASLWMVQQTFKEDGEFDEVGKKILNEATTDRRIPKEVHFEWLPERVVGPYCGTDSFATIKLYDEYDANSTDKERSAFWSYQTHAKLSVRIEADGICWDDEYAEELSQFYKVKQLEHLSGLITHPLFTAANGLTIHQVIDAKSTTNIDRLKSVFNPGSNHKNTTTMFVRSLSTNRFCFGSLLYQLNEQYVNGDLATFHPLYSTIVAFANPVIQGDPKELDPLEKDKQFAAARKILFKQCYDDATFRQYVVNACPLEWSQITRNPIDSLDSSHVETFYNMFTFIGNNINDSSTWDPEFELLFHYRYCKKVTKSLTTYIQGSVGRGSVFVVNTTNLSLSVPTRMAYNKKLQPEQVHFLQPRYNYNGAETRRWKSPMHTIPWSCELRDIQMTRWSDSILLHVDYSQMEVRTMAALADEAAMLQAFMDGKDIHRFVASRVFGISEDQVLPEQRRFSKMATFSLLYGKTVFSFAMDFMKGDLQAAEKLFHDFFTEFPNIRKFIDHCHWMLHNEGYVETIYGDRIYIDFDKQDKRMVSSAERHSQNYPIQGSASNLAAEGLYYTAEDLHKQGVKFGLFGFTHDSGDFDMHVPDLLRAISAVRKNMETDIRTKFNVPVAVDYEMGLRGNSMLSLEIEHVDDKMMVAEFKATEKGFKETSERMKAILGNKVDFQLHGAAKDDYQSLEFLFLTRRAFSKYLGETIPKVKGKMALVA